MAQGSPDRPLMPARRVRALRANAAPHGEADPVAPDPGADLVDWRLLRDAAGFVARSVRRHRRLAGSFLAGTLLLSIFALWAMPRTWHVEARVLVQRNGVIPALGNPQRAVPDGDLATRGASDAVMSHDNLVALVKATSLISRWDQGRAPLHRLKDKLAHAVGKPISDEDKLDALVGLLEKKLIVEAGDGTVNFSLDWPDGELAYRLVDAAQSSFIEARRVAEVSSIAEAISILDGHLGAVRGQIDGQLQELQRLEPKPGAPAGRSRQARPTPALQPAPAAPSEEATRLGMAYAGKKKALEDLEEYRRRRLAELQGKLGEARGTYVDKHPVVQALLESIEQLEADSPQVSALKAEVARLGREVAAGGAPQQPVNPVLGERDHADALYASRPQEGAARADGRTEVLRGRLAQSLRKYESLQERIEAARIELDTTRAAFKYRYAVVRPAQAPKKPVKPSPVGLILGGLFGGLAMGVLAAVATDLRRGKFVEGWQAERLLDLPLLGEVRAP